MKRYAQQAVLNDSNAGASIAGARIAFANLDFWRHRSDFSRRHNWKWWETRRNSSKKV